MNLTYDRNMIFPAGRLPRLLRESDQRVVGVNRIHHGAAEIELAPHETLEPGTRYRVVLPPAYTREGNLTPARTWTFTTAP